MHHLTTIVWDLATAREIYRHSAAEWSPGTPSPAEYATQLGRAVGLLGAGFTADGRRLLMANKRDWNKPEAAPAGIIELPSGAPLLQVKEPLEYVKFSRAGDRIAFTYRFETDPYCFYLGARDLATGRELLPAQVIQGMYAFSADGSRIAAVTPRQHFPRSYSTDLVFYDLAAGTQTFFRPRGAKDHIFGWDTQLVLSPSGTFCLAAGGDGRLFDTRTGALLHTFPLAIRVAIAACFAGESRVLIATKSGTLHLYDTATYEEIHRFEMRKSIYMATLSVSDDAAYALLSVDMSGTLNLYRLPN